MHRRAFVAGMAAALILPERKIWALDQTMILPRTEYITLNGRRYPIRITYEQDFIDEPMPGGMVWWAEQSAKKNPLGPLSIYDLDEVLRNTARKHRYLQAKDALNRRNHYEPA